MTTLPSMVESQRPSFQVSLSEAQLHAPETPHYLELALRLLEARLAELRDGAAPAVPPTPPPASPPPSSSAPPQHQGGQVDITTPPQAPPPPSQSLPRTPQAPATGRRARWFHVQLPRITLEDGGQATPRSLEELKELLRSRGLTPHPRGDASMLLWQVRNRLGGTVEAVAI